MTGEQSPAQLADAAAESIRSANHTTFRGAIALTWPSGCLRVISSLSVLASRLPQLLGQLDRWLTGQVEHRRVVVDGGEYANDPQAAAADASH